MVYQKSFSKLIGIAQPESEAVICLKEGKFRSITDLQILTKIAHLHVETVSISDDGLKTDKIHKT